MKQRIPILIAALLAASTFSGAYAKSYDIPLQRPIIAGSTQIPAGLYRLEIKEGTATLTNSKTGKTLQLPVNVTNADTKFKETTVQTGQKGEQERLRIVELGGSKMRLEFEN